LGDIAVAEKRFAEGMRFLGAADMLRTELRTSFRPAAGAALGQVEAAWRSGAETPVEQIVREALS
jgi:hypothetical protein